MIKAIIVNNKKAYTEVLIRILSGYPMDVVACFERTWEAEEYIKNNETDIAFIDTVMQESSGYDLQNLINSIAENNCISVFINACNADSEDKIADYRDKISYTIGKITRKIKISEPRKAKVRCFNSFKIFVGGDEVKFRTNKATELIAFLIHKQGYSVSRSEIIDNLWGDFDGDRALINFNTTLSYVKKALMQYELNIPIIFDRGSYRIDTANFDCDYYTFMDCNLEKNRLNETTVAYYEKMLALYSGDYFIANDYRWAENRRLFLKDKYVRIFLSVARYYESVGNYPRVIELLETSFLTVPMNREITYNLVKALIYEGNYSLALSYFKMHRDALHSELNIDPDISLKRLIGIA